MGKTLSVIVVAAASFGAGAVAGLLFAPASGEENRKRLAQQVKKQTEGLEHQLKEVEKSISNLEDQVRSSGQELGSRVKTAANSAMDKFLPEVPENDAWQLEKTDLTTDLPHLPKV